MNVSNFDTLALEETLEDLSARFIVNLPAEELESLDRVCFQIEQAHWYYEDFVRPQASNPALLPSFSLKQFSLLIFKTCPLLSDLVPQHAAIWTSFMAYKERVPVCGAILIAKDWDKVLLVKGWNKGASWSFPRGKINKGESEAACAVLEETGFDLSDYFSREQLRPGFEEEEGSERNPYYVEVVIKEQKIRLYFIPDIAEDTFFETRTRKEISKIEWFKLGDLPTWTKERKNKKGDTPVQSVKSAKFYMVTPFISHLKLWIERNRPKKKRRQQQQQQAVVDDNEVPALQPATMTNEESTAALKAFFFGAGTSSAFPESEPSIPDSAPSLADRHPDLIQPRPKASPQQTSNLLALLRSSPTKTQRDWEQPNGESSTAAAAAAQPDSEQERKRQALLKALFAATSATPPPTDTPRMAPQMLGPPKLPLPGEVSPVVSHSAVPTTPDQRLLSLLQGGSQSATSSRSPLPAIPAYQAPAHSMAPSSAASSIPSMPPMPPMSSMSSMPPQMMPLYGMPYHPYPPPAVPVPMMGQQRPLPFPMMPMAPHHAQQPMHPPPQAFANSIHGGGQSVQAQQGGPVEHKYQLLGMLRGNL